MASISIENFGAIRDAHVALGKVTVLVGPQGCGKSTVARLYAAFLWLEKSLARKSLRKSDCTVEYVVSSVFAYVQIDHLIRDDTRIRYRGDRYSISFTSDSVEIKARKGDYSLPKILYIPSERSFISVVDDIRSIRNLPSVMYELASEYSVARSLLGTSGYDIPIDGFHFDYSSSNDASIISDKERTYGIPLDRAASGIQSVLPLALVYDSSIRGMEYKGKAGKQLLSVEQVEKIRKLSERFTLDKPFVRPADHIQHILSIAGIDSMPSSKEAYQELAGQLGLIVDSHVAAIIEEPEQNLFPDAQRQLIEHIVERLNVSGSSVLITTHSPYVLAALNNLIYAGSLSGKKGVDSVVPAGFQLSYKDVMASYIEDGTCASIKDDGLRMLDPSSIDSCSRTINDIYSRLEDIEFGEG